MTMTFAPMSWAARAVSIGAMLRPETEPVMKMSPSRMLLARTAIRANSFSALKPEGFGRFCPAVGIGLFTLKLQLNGRTLPRPPARLMKSP